MPLGYAREHGANFVTPNAWAAARARTARVEAHQSLDHQRLWADLMSSSALAFNLFGDLAADLLRADRAVHAWFPDAPGRVSDVRFAYSPGWLDPAYLNNLRSFDAAFLLNLHDGGKGIVAVDVNYRERNKDETPRPENLVRYTKVTRRSEAFASDALSALKRRSDLCTMWLEHLLVHSMLQHPSRTWTWGRCMVVHPAKNSDLVDTSNRYRAMLVDETTHATLTLEQLLDTRALPRATSTRLRDRYVPK